MRDSIGWSEWTVVACLAVLVGAGECGHDSANDQSTESSEAAESSEGGKQAEESDEESSQGDEEAETDMQRAEIERVENPDVDRETLQKLVRDTTAFGFDLYGELRSAREEENLVFAPYNLSQVLAMTYPGARGETRSEMREALHFELDEPALHEAFNMLDGALQTPKAEETGGPGGGQGKDRPDVLRTATGLFSQAGFSIKQPFLKVLGEHYGTGVGPVDFENAPEEARSKINAWAAQRTNDEIRELMPSGAVDSRTRLVLTAALYFRAQWAESFDEEDTTEEEFRNLSGETTAVEMMHERLRTEYRYAEGEKYQAVELRYDSGAYAMVVVLPEKGAFTEVESDVDASFVESLFESLETQPVDLSLPKFELRGKFSVASALQKLGMEKAFTSSADLTGITEEQDLVVDDVLHETFISVDEKGTEAAAASAAAMRATSGPAEEPDYREVKIDRPFLFMIRHTGTDALLFVGSAVAL